MHVHANTHVWVRRPGPGAANGAAPSPAEWVPAVVVDETPSGVTVKLEDGQQAAAALSDVELRADDSEVQVGRDRDLCLLGVC